LSAQGELQVSIEMAGKFGPVVVRPTSRAIQTRVSGNTISFAMSSPDRLYIEVDGLPPLCLFADPIEENAPTEGTPNVRYFGPGVHRPGYLTLSDNETVYIAAGAIVYGGIRAKGARNIRVMGRGILDANYEFSRMVLVDNSSDVRFEGITLRHSRSWTVTVTRCENVLFRDVKVFGFGNSSDGINPLGSSRVAIERCFLRCTDDCIAVKAPQPDMVVDDLRVERNTMMGFAFTDGFTIGFETNGPSIRNVVVRDCDILMARGGSRVDGHSGFSIVCDGPAVISDILFEDIRVERAEIKLFELIITDGTKYQVDPPGHIRNVRVRNVSWAHEGPISLQGFSAENQIEGVTFENCRVAGQPLAAVRDRVLRIGPFVEGVTVTN
jgi:polygalacturonase